VHKIFGGCISAVLSCRVRKVKVSLTAHDGARIITLSTPFRITENKVAKDYDIDVGLMYSGEYKSLLFRLSLRKMEKMIKQHDLLNIEVQFLDILSNQTIQITKQLSVERLNVNSTESIPPHLDQNLNRYNGARSIIEAIELGNSLKFTEAQEKLKECINNIRSSPTGSDPYCEHLIEDLEDCITGMTDSNSFQNGIHSAHAYASMYYMERSSGVEIRKQSVTIDNIAYRYVTDIQIEGQDQFCQFAPTYLSKYFK